MVSTVIEENTKLVKKIAYDLGFDFVGISRAQKLEKEAKQLENWLHQGKHGKMHYMEQWFDKRLDPTLLVPGSKSVISLGYNYYTETKQNTESFKLSKYAYGFDYHEIIKSKLKFFIDEIQRLIGAVSGRAFVDSAPVMERQWAQKSGLGWIGKNSLLINKNRGSFFFLAELILDIELQADLATKDYCGTCTKCIDACPTEAIVDPYVVDGSKCISYLTIELKDQILPTEFKGKMDNWMFGCDVCQDVCPWNRFSTQHKEPKFNPNESMMNFSKQEWKELTEDVFNQLFKNSPIKRTKFEGLKRNIGFLE